MSVPPRSPNLPAVATRLVSLDFLRGVAIIMVMGTHFSYASADVPWLDAVIGYLKRTGGAGVNLFFTLSGYLVGGLLMHEIQRSGTLRAGRFLVRRAFKIWPPLYVLVLVHAVLGRHPINSFLWQNLLHVQNYAGTSVTQTWSLAVEEHFYIALAVCLYALRGLALSRLLWGLCLICALTLAARWHAVSTGDLDGALLYTHFRMDSLLLGVALAALQVFKPEVVARVSRAWPLCLGVSIGLFVLLDWFSRDTVAERSFGYTLEGVGFVALILLVRDHTGALARGWAFRAVAWVGCYSYGIYLWHTFALAPGHLAIRWLAAHQVYPLLACLMVIALQGGIAITLGYLTTRLIEWPALRLRDRWFPAAGHPVVAPAQEVHAEGAIGLSGRTG